jgi:hypothetical protein
VTKTPNPSPASEGLGKTKDKSEHRPYSPPRQPSNQNLARAAAQFPCSGVPESGEEVLSSAKPVSVAQRAEEGDDYPTICILNARWRVVACKNSIQWILQRRCGPNHWRGQYFCRTRDGLVCCAREHVGPIGAAALVILLRLPEHFPPNNKFTWNERMPPALDPPSMGGSNAEKAERHE